MQNMKLMRMPILDGCSSQEPVSIKKAIKAWKALWVPIEKATGYKCTAFDPGLTFTQITPSYEERLVYKPNGKIIVKKVRRRNDQGKPLSNFGRNEMMSTQFAYKLAVALKGKQK